MLGVLGLVWLLSLTPGRTDEQPRTILKTERFDTDPNWEGFNNRIAPERVPTVTQDFGYSPTNFSGKGKGEIGGQITRCSKPAFYGDKISIKTLNDPLTASGTFAFTRTGGSGGVFFGWFHHDQPGGGGRPMNSLGLEFDGEKTGARLAVRMITGSNRSCGTFITPFIPGKFRPTPIRADGTRYSWTLRYDPQANHGNGSFQFAIKNHGTKPEELDAGNLPARFPERFKMEALSHFPNTMVFSVDVPEVVRKSGATFDHFGLMNGMKAGGPMTVYFDDLQYNGKVQNFGKDPGWEGSGNRTSYQDRERAGAHDYGFSATTNCAGSTPGEVGGVLWRSGKYSYYADRVGPLTCNDRLEASGKVMLKMGAPDSDVYLGWFNSADKGKPPNQAGHFLGVHVGGPTRVGHYFHPALVTATGSRGRATGGPVLVPGQVYDWSLIYDPTAEGGQGAVQVILGKETMTLTLKKGLKAEGASFDRFGLFTPAIGGQIVRIYLDDLTYTVRARR
jgi:hypothetical protein